MSIKIKKVNKIALFFAVAFLVLFALAAYLLLQSKNTKTNDLPSGGQIVNPASEYCVKQGGKLDIRKNSQGGEYGICVFAVNKECEEWALFHGYCPTGGIDISNYKTVESQYCVVIGGTYTNKNTCSFSNGAECSSLDIYNSKCRQHFNEPATAWKYLKYKDPNIMIGYQSEVAVLEGQPKDENQQTDTLKIEIDKIAGLSGVMADDPQIVYQEEAALNKGTFGPSTDFSVKASNKVVKLDDTIFGKEYMVLGRFDVCDVTFERVLVFYRNGYRVKLTLSGDKDKIINENSSYFTFDKSCNAKAWNYKKDNNIQNTFYTAAVNGKLSVNAGNWYYPFDLMTDAVVINK